MLNILETVKAPRDKRGRPRLGEEPALKATQIAVSVPGSDRARFAKQLADIMDARGLDKSKAVRWAVDVTWHLLCGGRQ